MPLRGRRRRGHARAWRATNEAGAARRLTLGNLRAHSRYQGDAAALAGTYRAPSPSAGGRATGVASGRATEGVTYGAPAILGVKNRGRAGVFAVTPAYLNAEAKRAFLDGCTAVIR